MRFTHGRVLFVVFALFSLWSTSASAAVRFKATTFNLPVPVDRPYSLHLASLLENTGSGRLRWSIIDPLPSWMTYDAAESRLHGTPGMSHLGQTRVTVTVSDGESGSITVLVINATAAPIWAGEDINLGVQTVGTPWSFDLRTVVTDPTGGTLTFTATGLPPWMSISPEGILSGTPQRLHVGSYAGIVFTATGRGGASQSNGHGTVIPRGSDLAVLGPDNITSNTCRKYSVATRDGDGNPLIPTADLAIGLQVRGALAADAFLFTTAGCGGSPVSAVTVRSGSSAADFYLYARATGRLEIAATAPSFTEGRLPVQVVDGQPRIVLASGVSQAVVGSCVAVNLSLQDASGETWIPSADTPIALTASRPDVKLFSLADCSGPTTSLTLPRGTSAAIYYAFATVAEAKTLFASSPGLTSGSLALSFVADRPVRSLLLAESTRVLTDTCVALRFELRDRFDNPAPVPTASGDIEAALDAVGDAASGVTFYRDPQCTSRDSTVGVRGGAFSAPLYLIGSVPGSFTVTATPPTPIAAAALSLLAVAPPRFAWATVGDLDFGKVTVNQTADRSLFVRNEGGEGSFTSISIVGDRFTVLPSSTCRVGTAVPIAGSCRLDLRFAPVVAGVQLGAVALVSATGTLNGQLRGEGVAPPSFAILGASDLDFGDVNVGASGDLSMVVQNRGGEGAFPPLTPPGAPFSILPSSTCAQGMAMAALASCRIDLRFAPTAAGVANGTVGIGSHATARLRGRGIVPARFLLVGGPHLDFGDVPIHQLKELSLTLWNQGGDGVLRTARLEGDRFSLVGGTCRDNLPMAAGATCTLVIRFAPVVAGPRAGKIAVETDVGPVVATLAGRGISAGILAFVPPGGLSFGRQPVGSRHLLCVTLSNVGGAPITLGAMTLAGGAPFALLSSSACGLPCFAGMSMTPAASCGVQVAWNPTVEGDSRDWMRVEASTLGIAIPATYPLSGTAFVPPPPTTARITANGQNGLITASPDQAVTVAWSSTNAQSCLVTMSDLDARYAKSRVGPIVAGTWVGPTWNGTSHPGVPIAPGSEEAWRDVTYTLTCQGAGGNAASTVRVRRYVWAAGGGVQVAYLLGSQAEAMSCKQKIYSGVKLDPECRHATWGTAWADGTRNPWWLKPNTAPGGGKWCTCFNPKTAPAGKPWASQSGTP